MGALSALALAASVGLVTPSAAPALAGNAVALSAQADSRVAHAVQRAFADVLPDQPMRFALDTSQESPVAGGGRRYEGSGIATFNDGDPRFVSFTMTLSVRGELVEFDYSTTPRTDDADYVAGY